MNRERIEIISDAFHLINNLVNSGEWDKITNYFKLMKEDAFNYSVNASGRWFHQRKFIQAQARLDLLDSLEGLYPILKAEYENLSKTKFRKDKQEKLKTLFRGRHVKTDKERKQ